MDFQHQIGRIQDTLIVVTEIQRRQAEIRPVQAAGMALHEVRMSHIDECLSRMAGRLDRLIGFRDGPAEKQ
jgi:hypothetical protein